MSDVLNVELGTCKIYANGVDMGHSIGGCEFIYSPEYHDTRVDEFGGVARRWLISEDVRVRVPLAEKTLANLKRAIAHSVQGADFVSFGSKAGKSSDSAVFLLKLHPIANHEADFSDDVVLYKAHSVGEITIPFKNDGESIIECEFAGIIDQDRTDGNLLGLIGDSL